ncbi:hypothetical protein [Streptomyces cyaneofuscatus]|uniref:hypothetical protein n=1 Tax=Streptomyces cyaneofuscatus TaxID=66883 RepID=UPI0036DCA7A6
MSAYLNAAERQFLTFALDLAADRMASRGDEFEDADHAALETFRRMAAEPDGAGTAEFLASLRTSTEAAERAAVDRSITDQFPAIAVDRWNALHPVGTPVYAYPGCRPEDDPKCTQLTTRTRSVASVLGGHTAVVWVDGHSACISLTHVDPRPEHGLITAVRSTKEGRSKWVVRWRENGKPRQRTFHNPTHAKGWRTYLIRIARDQQGGAR